MPGTLADVIVRIRAEQGLGRLHGMIARAGEASALLTNRFRTLAVVARGGFGRAVWNFQRGRLSQDELEAAISLARRQIACPGKGQYPETSAYR